MKNIFFTGKFVLTPKFADWGRMGIITAGREKQPVRKAVVTEGIQYKPNNIARKNSKNPGFRSWGGTDIPAFVVRLRKIVLNFIRKSWIMETP